jgi:enoyl-CoA hydratase/3-hydroxyacyl-CoA dehydrogenase
MALLKNIGVVGAGKTGIGIAERIALEGCEVVLVDIKPEIVENALVSIRQRLLASSQKSDLRYPEPPDQILKRIHASCDSNTLAETPFVIECLPEELEIKHDTLRRLSQICSKETVFTTTVSSLRIADFAKGLSFSDRLVGMHFFKDPAVNRLVEIVPASASRRAQQLLRQVARMMGGIVIESADAHGFSVKQQAAALFSEAVRILNEGKANIPTIDAGAKKAFGIDKGPFTEMNAEGIGIAEFYARGLLGNLPGLYLPPERLKAQVATNEAWSVVDGDVDDEKSVELAERFVGLAVLVGATVADQGIARPEDVNLGAKLGLGFQKGPFDIINELGVERALALVSKTAASHQVPVPGNLKAFAEKGISGWSLERVTTDIRNGVATLTLRHPETMNALDAELVLQLESALKAAEKNDAVKMIVITGMGKTLASGPAPEFLVEKIEADDINGIIGHYKRIHALFAKIAGSKKITIARARGLAASGGVELGLACKYLVASSRSFFAFPETGNGIHPGLGATQRLPRKVGKSIGKYVIMTGEVLTAQAAERLGIVDAIIDDDDAIALLFNNLGESESLSDDGAALSDDELAAISLFNPANCAATLAGNITNGTKTAGRIKAALAKKAPAALTLVNKLIDDGLGLEISKAMDFEISALSLILGTKDALRGLRAVGRTEPRFTGE